MELIVFIFLILIIGTALLLMILKRLKPQFSWMQKVFVVLFVLALFAFFLGMFIHNNPYHQAIDPIDTECYSPFGAGQLPTVIFYAIGFYGSLFLLWWKGNQLPPLTAVLSAIFVLIGWILSSVFIMQLSGHDISSLEVYNLYDDGFWLLFPLPIWNAIAAFFVLWAFITKQREQAYSRSFKNKFLQKINLFIIHHYHQTVWMSILLFPVLFLCSLILVLFGQDYNSLTKVFTDTATWTFSQQTHPPILDHQGHYLCTVAAKGNPKIVKPVGIGKRGGRTIIVNRQLQIANAFEELICDISPALHRFIRWNYDRYGYNLSKKINSSFWSDVTYILMKPLEWFFLGCLYLCCRKPEQKIKRQYQSLI